jgi:peptidoglycan/LPS O-acetylase OafA/YrhL
MWVGIALLLLMMWTTAPLGDVVGGLQTPRVYWHFTAVALAFALMIVGALRGAGFAVQAVLESRALGFVGRISYSLYLWHYPVLELTQRAWPSGPDGAGLVWWLVRIAAVIAIAWASYHWVERPFLQRRRSGAVAPT